MNAVTTTRFDRSKQDAGNILSLEHCNMRVTDQRPATVFYVEGLGLTRDPYMHTTDANMWINLGRHQFHLPTNVKPQVLRGEIGVVTPYLALARERLQQIEPKLAGTRFSWTDEGKTLLTSCPWGNRIRVHAPGEFGHMILGIPYVEFPVPRGAADGIARFYSEVFKARTTVTDRGGDRMAEVQVGLDQALRFLESDTALAPYDQHHVAIYIADFSSPHQWLTSRALVTEESDDWQYRFDVICDPASGAPLFSLEHEVRSVSHPMYPRHLSQVNRNPHQTQNNYLTGRDAYYAPESAV